MRLMARVARAAAALGAALLVARPGAAAAHPNLIASGPLRAGEPTRLTLIILGDEGAFHGADVTFPVSFHLTGAHAIGPDLGTPVVDGQVVHLSGFDVAAGRLGQMYVDGTPTVTGPLTVSVVSHLDAGTDYRYPPLAVQVGSGGGGGGVGGGVGKALPAGLIAGAGALVAAGWALRRRRAGSRPAAG